MTSSLGSPRIFRLRDKPGIESLSTPIKLLEINIDTAPSGIMPLRFRPVPGSGIPYPSVIVEVTPDEFERIQLQELKLPDGWTIDEEYPRSSDARSPDLGDWLYARQARSRFPNVREAPVDRSSRMPQAAIPPNGFEELVKASLRPEKLIPLHSG